MGIRTDKLLRQRLIFFSLLLLVAALFTSRALLSAGIFLLLFLTCIHQDFLQQLRRFATDRMLVGMSLLFLLPALSWFWSSNAHDWLRWTRIKLPLFLLPLAFAGPWRLSARQWKWLALFFLVLTTIGCCWSLWQYLRDAAAIHQNYLRAGVFATPLENDHVRYSLLVCVAVICASMLAAREQQRALRVALWTSAVFFAAYLHILSARTGLAGLYIFLLLYIIRLLRRLSMRRALLPALVLVLMPLLAWLVLPTFRNRLQYILYDLSFVRQEQYRPGTSDGDRMLSLRAGWDLVVHHPLGVGSGDVVDETRAWYAVHVPGMLDTDKLYPSSEWLLYGATAGWAGILIFTVAMALPFFEKIGRPRFFWISLNIIAALSLLFDIGLETQFGVFIYAFTILWWWKWLQEDNAVSTT